MFRSSPRLAASSRVLLFAHALTTTSRLSAVSDTERPPMRGLPCPICQNHWLTSYTLLTLLPSTAASSAVPNWNSLSLRCHNSCGMVGVATSMPFRNKGKSGTLPSIRSQGPTYRIGGAHTAWWWHDPWAQWQVTTLEKQLRTCVPCFLDGHVGGILQAEGLRRKNKATILAQYGQTGISQDNQQCMCLIRYNLG